MPFKVYPAAVHGVARYSFAEDRVLQRSPSSILCSLKRKILSAIERMRPTGAFEKDDTFCDGISITLTERQYLSVRRTDSMESLANFIGENMARFENANPGPLFPLSEYGNTCFMRGCEEMHIESSDKSHSVVTHCDCNPRYPDLQHRHIFEYSDLLDPPIQNRPQESQSGFGFLDIDSIRRLLILTHPHYPSVWARRTRSISTVDDRSDTSSMSSFEIHVRITTPEENIVASSPLKTRRESQEARDLLIQNGRPVWWNSRSGDLREHETHPTDIPI